MENTFAYSYFVTFFIIYIHHDVCNVFLCVEVTVDSIFCTDDLLK
jgi:hypothetical protein